MSDTLVKSNLGIDPDTLKQIYVQMSRIHEVDKAIKAGQQAGKMFFSYWPMTGQECIPATISTMTDNDDYMVTIYRGIHDQVAKGVDLKGLFAETLGKSAGVNKGKGGSPIPAAAPCSPPPSSVRALPLPTVLRWRPSCAARSALLWSTSVTARPRSALCTRR